MQLPKQFYYKNNRLQQLRGFYYSVQTGSISKAAEKIGLTQSAVTLQIQSLERDLKTQLFDRNKKKIEITEAGKILYSCSIPYIQGIDDLFKSFITSAEKKKLSTVNMAANHVSISYILPKYVEKFSADYPSAKFNIRNLSKEDAIQRLINDEIDFFVYPIYRDEVPEELEFIPIVTYQPILLVRQDHPLAKKSNINLSDVAKYNLVRIDPKFITLPAFEDIIKSHGIKTNIEFETADWEILKKFVSDNVGVAIISNIVLEGESQSNLVGKSLTNYFPEMTYGILFKKGKIFSGLPKDFVKMLQTEKLLDAHKRAQHKTKPKNATS
ncbi:MAG: LysR family transcriptional regulator [Rickettsiaceae bacterium]|jgi:DNA-binding transcriptional LysR family regulator|nr:LysR family transcriptional regulator [Rickettsiaceae bacterium]